MIVPQYWAEANARHRKGGRQVTVRRFGWSDDSQAAAQENAEQRCQEALAQILAGAQLERREPKIPYNGAEGVPIREEIVSRHGDTIITRNSYGAECLNTPNVLFVDIDFPDGAPFKFSLAVLVVLELCAIAAGFVNNSLSTGVMLGVLSLMFFSVVAGWLYQIMLNARGGNERRVLDRIGRFLAAHPDWSLRVYRSPAGIRVLVTHRTFQPDEPEVGACFEALGADPMYAMMCKNQKCFRARVSPKPWRIGIGEHMRPRPGHWPVAPERLPLRQAWVAKYEQAAKAYASCSFIGTQGKEFIHMDVADVVALHDRMSRARESLPIA